MVPGCWWTLPGGLQGEARDVVQSQVRKLVLGREIPGRMREPEALGIQLLSLPCKGIRWQRRAPPPRPQRTETSTGIPLPIEAEFTGPPGKGIFLGTQERPHLGRTEGRQALRVMRVASLNGLKRVELFLFGLKPFGYLGYQLPVTRLAGIL